VKIDAGIGTPELPHETSGCSIAKPPA